MAGLWRIIGKGADASPPTISEFLHLSNANIQKINFLTSNKLSHSQEPLNPKQCRSLSSKLVRTLENVAGLFFFWDQAGSTSTAATLLTGAFENFYLVSERAKEVVESCCNEDWCQASAFQIQNEEAFKDILLETSLCYSAIYELIKDKVPYQDLRQTTTFEPPPSAEVMEDQLVLLQRYQDFADREFNLDSFIQKQHLARHLLRRLEYIISQSEDFDVTTASSWSYGDEWGTNSEFLGGNVCKTTWLGVPCAKKVFDDGVQEEHILAEARILALVNHPNIVKFISYGYDKDNTWHFIAMEHMETSLCSMIKKRTQARKGAPFPILSAVHIMLQIAYGTCYLHDKGIAHRDVKTPNVVVRQYTAPHLQDYLHVKLVDFGLSKVKLSASRSNTISQPRIGTTVYRAPEAFHHGRADWFKADVYSFGIMCYVILSGKEPFPSPEYERSKVYEAICSGKRPLLPLETPEDLARLIKECWDSDRNIRPNFVDICTRLAQIRHKLLKEDPHGRRFKNDLDNSASLYIQDRIITLSTARKQDYKQLLGTLIEEDEWFAPSEEFGIYMSHAEPKMTTSYRSKSSSSVEVPVEVLKFSASQNSVDYKRRLSSRSPLTRIKTMPSPSQTDKGAGKSEEPTYLGSVQPGDIVGLERQLVSTLVDKMKDTLVIQGDGTSKLLEKKKQGRVSTPESAHVVSSPGMQGGEAEEPTSPGGSSPLWVQPGDLTGLKRQLVQLLNEHGGMKLSRVPAKYNKLFGRPLCLAEYNAQRLVHLIDKMKDTLVIEGDGASKTLHLARKKTGRVLTNKSTSSSNQAFSPKGDKDKDTSEDSNPEGTRPDSKDLEETAKNSIDGSKTVILADSKVEYIKVEEFVGDVHRTNLTNFKRQLQELLVAYSYQIPYNDFVKAYRQRFAQILDLPSFGVVTMEALFDKVKDVAVIKDKPEGGRRKFYLVAV